jgi:hypothetical protein
MRKLGDHWGIDPRLKSGSLTPRAMPKDEKSPPIFSTHRAFFLHFSRLFFGRAMSLIVEGTNAKCRDIRFTSVIGWTSDVKPTSPDR